MFSDTEQNSSRIKVFEQNFEQNKRFLRALPLIIVASLNLSKPNHIPFVLCLWFNEQTNHV